MAHTRYQATRHPARSCWSETEGTSGFFRIPCLFRPLARSAVKSIALTGHLGREMNCSGGPVIHIGARWDVEKARELKNRKSRPRADTKRAGRVPPQVPTATPVAQPHSAPCKTPCATCCRRSRPCSTGGLVAQVERLNGLAQGRALGYGTRAARTNGCRRFPVAVQTPSALSTATPDGFSIKAGAG